MLPINEALKEYSGKYTLRMHMPAHGGKTQGCFLDGVFSYDVTETDETDDLFNPAGAIKRSEEELSKTYNSLYSFYSCGGATLALQGAVLSAVKLTGKRSPKVLCERNVHKSVVNALAFSGITPVWFYNDEILNEKPDCDIFIITSCNYFGDICNFEKIEAAFKNKNTVLIADNSHGSHLMFLDKTKHSLTHGFDFVIDSLHKSTPALTGSALLHIGRSLPSKIGKKKIEIGFTVKETMSTFSSSSPSFLILASAEFAVYKIKSESNKLKKAESLVLRLKEKFPDCFSAEKEKNKSKDPLKLVINCEKNVKNVCETLKKHNINYEFYTEKQIVLLLPFGFSEEDALRIETALLSALAVKQDTVVTGESCNDEKKHIFPKMVMSMSEAISLPSELIRLEESVGKISSSTYGLYPPGIPIIMPGEVFTDEIIDVLKEQYEFVNIVKQDA